ncbi:MAG: hypothetical protein LBO78_02135 [Rickettsiales bacterium]|jgi:hypothetical protein|nr:hypothetical protein [Rickettsiales bacterium]
MATHYLDTLRVYSVFPDRMAAMVSQSAYGRYREPIMMLSRMPMHEIMRQYRVDGGELLDFSRRSRDELETMFCPYACADVQISDMPDLPAERYDLSGIPERLLGYLIVPGKYGLAAAADMEAAKKHAESEALAAERRASADRKWVDDMIRASREAEEKRKVEALENKIKKEGSDFLYQLPLLPEWGDKDLEAIKSSAADSPVRKLAASFRGIVK